MTTKRIILITGASSGIGKACARIFAANGYDLILTARRKEKLIALQQELENKNLVRVLPLELDVRDQEAVKRTIDQLSPSWKCIDILINNAGLALGLSTIDEGNLQDWDTMIDTNVKGLLYMSRAVLPLMKTQGHGHVFNIGSTAAKDVYPKGNIYCATKHAVDALTKAMRIDLLPFNIKVTAIHPGAVETEFSQVRFKGDEQKAAQVYQGFTPLLPQDIAHILFFCATLPAHVCINDLVVTPTRQANSHYLFKN
ncbi:MAG: SDR family NAD(P)-dependent oxidoreductase [Chitinophagaceae bacterium]